MFYCLILFCTLVCTVWGEDKIILTVTPEQALHMHKHAKICGELYGVDPLLVKNMLDWTVPNEKKVIEFIYCLCYNGGYLTKEGLYQIDNMLEFPIVRGSKEEFRKNLEECNQLASDDHLENTFVMGACIQRKQRFQT